MSDRVLDTPLVYVNLNVTSQISKVLERKLGALKNQQKLNNF